MGRGGGGGGGGGSGAGGGRENIYVLGKTELSKIKH